MLDSPAYQELYLSKIREGAGRKEAAKLSGIDYTTVWHYGKLHPDFLERVRDAEAEQVESVFQFMQEVMKDDEIPLKDRLKAGETLLRYRARDQKSDHKVIEHQHTLQVTGGDQLERVLQLQRELEARTIDVEPIEERDD